MSKTLIHNIGTILSGAFENPILAGDTVCTDGDKIVFIGNRADAPALDYTLDIDANGLTLCPGIIDAPTRLLRTILKPIRLMTG
mgnify:CR=1 FL=1